MAFGDRRIGARGLALVADIPEYGLLTGDRLEPSDSIQDVGRFDDLSNFPLAAVFWRSDCETRAKHRNPIMAPELGITTDSLLVDLIQALFLGGVLKRLARRSFGSSCCAMFGVWVRIAPTMSLCRYRCQLCVPSCLHSIRDGNFHIQPTL